MRALRLCLFGAMCLHLVGCANPSQPPSFDPFVGRTLVPPPGTGLAAPENYYPESGSPSSAPATTRPGNTTGRYAPRDDADERSANGWRANSNRTRLASDDAEDDGSIENADYESTADDQQTAEPADYVEEVPEASSADEPRTNPIRPRSVKITARNSDADDSEVATTDE